MQTSSMSIFIIFVFVSFFVIFGIDIAISNSMMWSEFTFNSVWISCLNYEICPITKTRPYNIQRFFTAVKMKIFSRYLLTIFIFFPQNIDCGYTFEQPY